MAADPWKCLRIAGGMALGLGLLDLLRFGRPTILCVVEFPMTCLSLLSGWTLLRRRDSAFVTTSAAGGAILADALVSLVTIGPFLAHRLERAEEPFVSEEGAVALSCLILYGLQALFWPTAAFLVLRNLVRRGIPAAYRAHTRATVIGAFFVAAWIGGVTELFLKALIFRLT